MLKLSALFICFLSYAISTQAQKMETKTLLNDKVEIKIPSSFKEMSKEAIKERFGKGGAPPDIVFAEAAGSPSLSFALKENPADSSVIDQYVDMVEKSITNPLPATKILDKGIKYVSGKKIGFLVMVTPAQYGEIYSNLFFTDLDGKFLLCSFSCMNRSVDEWKATIDQIVWSLKIK